MLELGDTKHSPTTRRHSPTARRRLADNNPTAFGVVSVRLGSSRFVSASSRFVSVRICFVSVRLGSSRCVSVRRCSYLLRVGASRFVAVRFGSSRFVSVRAGARRFFFCRQSADSQPGVQSLGRDFVALYHHYTSPLSRINTTARSTSASVGGLSTWLARVHFSALISHARRNAIGSSRPWFLSKRAPVPRLFAHPAPW